MCGCALMSAASRSLCVGAAAACFWRKDFRFEDMPQVATLVFSGEASERLSPLALALLIVMVALQGGRLISGVRTNFLMVVVLSFFNFARTWSILSFDHFSGIAAVSAAFQLVRKPQRLKNRLREFRVATGPLYWASSHFAFYHGSYGSSWVRTGIAAAGIVLVTLAAFWTRPDNNKFDGTLAQWTCLPISVSPPHRAVYHGLFMLLSASALGYLALEHQCTRIFAFFSVLILMEFWRRLQQS
eukprot:TRINITY_DN23902_c0_g1_i3.p1 TRINITY_DN23902_c0_g1~~TRINITY_DN23902_c0_g1_i3.p1  ORF type:complete len:243 (+),score=22.93 TRINITY_DN23902_c0_g1_i3:59-787(+)